MARIIDEMKKSYLAILEADAAARGTEKLPMPPPPEGEEGAAAGLPPPPQGGEGAEGGMPPPPEGMGGELPPTPEGTPDTGEEGSEDMENLENLASPEGSADKEKLGKILKGIMGACKRNGVFVVSTDENATIKVDGKLYIIGIKGEQDEDFTSAYRPQ